MVEAHEALSDGSLDAEERKEKLEALRRLPLREERAQRVREACVTLHESLLEGSRLTAEARARVDAFEAIPAEARDADEGAAIAELLARSHRALRRSEEVRDACLRGIQTLESEVKR